MTVTGFVSRFAHMAGNHQMFELLRAQLAALESMWARARVGASARRLLDLIHAKRDALAASLNV